MFRPPPTRRLASLATALAAGLLVGCEPQAPIVQYSVAKETLPPRAAPQKTVRVKNRTLGAIVPQGGLTWYFKLTGPDAPVEALKGEFLALMQSIGFSKGPAPRPTWTLPEGWTEHPGDDNRFATLKSSEPNPLDTSVTALEADGNDPAYLLANINRWRRQVGLPPTMAEALYSSSVDEEVRRETFNGIDLVLVSVAGEVESGASGPAPFAPFAGGSSSPPPNASVAPLTFKVPEGWTKGKAGTGMRKAAFEVADGKQKVEITAVLMPVVQQAANWPFNVNRWRGQVGLKEAASADIEKATRTLTVAGRPSQSIDLTSPQGADKPQSILAAMSVRGDEVWFFKLQGDAPLAAREKAKFEQFVESVQFP